MVDVDMKTPLPEDSDLECFLPVNKALRFDAVTLTPTHPSLSLSFPVGGTGHRPDPLQEVP